MATATRTRKPAAKPVEEPEVDEFEEIEDDATDDDDLEELEEVEEEPEEAPKTKRKPSIAAAKAAREASAPKFGSAQLAAHVTEVTGETYDARGIRMLLRKLAKDGKLDRVVGESRDRYSFTGPEDPTVKAVVAMIKSGEAKALKQAGLEKVKEQAAAKKAAKKAAAPVVEEDDAEDMEEVEEAPAKPTRTRAKATAPAKATATRRRTAAK